jgi:predicted MFS family arabinose efflux permease
MKGDFRVSEVKSRREIGMKFKELYVFMKTNKPCFYLVVILSLHYLGTGAWVALIAVFLKRTLFAADSAFGIVMSIIAVGSLAGGFLAPLSEKKMPQPRPIQLSLFLFSVAMLAMITLKTLPITYAMFVLIGIGNAYFSIGLNSYFQQNLESSILGRVFGAVNTITMLINVISMGIGGLLSDRIGIENVYIAGAICVSIAAILSFVLLKPKGTRQIIHSNA